MSAFYIVVFGFFAIAFSWMGMQSEVTALDEDSAEKVMRVQRVLIETAPVKVARESWALLHPLSCYGTWTKSCADFRPCEKTCNPPEEQ